MEREKREEEEEERRSRLRSAAAQRELLGAYRSEPDGAAPAKARHSPQRALAVADTRAGLLWIDAAAFYRHKNGTAEEVERLCDVLACEGGHFHKEEVCGERPQISQYLRSSAELLRSTRTILLRPTSSFQIVDFAIVLVVELVTDQEDH